MAIAFVKATKIEASTGTSASSATFSATAGNGLVCCITSNGASSTASASGGGGTWAIDASGNSSSDGLTITSAPNNAGGTNTLTVTSSLNKGITAAVLEFSGLPTSGIRDAISPAIHTGTSTTATTNSLTNVTASAVFVAMVADNASGTATTLTGTTAGWNYNPSSTDEPNSAFAILGTGYDIVSAVAAQSSAWTVTSSAWGALIAVYKAAPTSSQQMLAQMGCGA